MTLTSFSNVDVSKIDPSEYEEGPGDAVKKDDGDANRGLNLNELTGSKDGEQPINPYADDGKFTEEQLRPRDYKVLNMSEADVGMSLEVTSQDELVMKRLVTAGSGFDNAQPGWEVELAYTGRIVDGSTFDSAHAEQPRLVALSSGALPLGLELAVRTMLLGERSVITIKPSRAFGAAGDDALGVPGNATVEYDVELRRMIEVSLFAEGRVRKRVLMKSSGWETARENFEMHARWSGAVLGGASFQEEVDFHFVAYAPGVPDLWQELVIDGEMKLGETAEFTVPPGDFTEWREASGAPADATVLLTITVVSWVAVEGVNLDGSIVKAKLEDGVGWERPKERHECVISLEVHVDGASDEPLLAKVGYTFPVAHLGQTEVDALKQSCGGADVAAVLNTGLPTMRKGERSELRCKPSAAGGSHGALRVVVHLHQWTKVELVPGTDEQVVRRVITAAPESVYERPDDDSVCQIRFQCYVGGQLITQSDEPVSFAQGDPAVPVLRCMHAAVMEMKSGELCRIIAPAAWAFGAGGELPKVTVTDASALAASDVEVDMELLSFERDKAVYEMETPEQIEAQRQLKERGTGWFKRGDWEQAARKYRKANELAPHVDDVTDEAEKRTVTSAKLACFLNIAACMLKLGRPTEAIEAANSALQMEQENVKALFRRGQARLDLRELPLAQEDLVHAARLDPKSRDIRQVLEQVKLRQKAEKDKEKAAFGGKLL